MDQQALKNINTTTLAFMGDAVYEARVREHLIERGLAHADRLHRAATEYVRADAQAKIIKALFDELTSEEQILVKRARNRKSVTKPKNADPVDYKWATAFEALVGWLYFKGGQDVNAARCRWVMNRAIEVIENERHMTSSGSRREL